MPPRSPAHSLVSRTKAQFPKGRFRPRAPPPAESCFYLRLIEKIRITGRSIGIWHRSVPQMSSTIALYTNTESCHRFAQSYTGQLSARSSSDACAQLGRRRRASVDGAEDFFLTFFFVCKRESFGGGQVCAASRAELAFYRRQR